MFIDVDAANVDAMREAALNLAAKLIDYQNLAFPYDLLTRGSMALRKQVGDAVQRVIGELRALGVPKGLLKPFKFKGSATRGAAVEQMLAVVCQLGCGGAGLGTEAFILQTPMPDAIQEHVEKLVEAAKYLEDGKTATPPAPPKLNDKQKKALAFIKRETKKDGGATAGQVAKRVDTTEGTVRRWCQTNPPGPLFSHGIRNNRDGEGYHLPM